MNHPALESFGDLDDAARDPHVATCPHCQDDLRAQVQVRALLAGLPDPGPTPPDVVDRIEATLRRLSAEQGPEASSPAAASTVVPLAPARERRHRGWLAVAAAVVLLGAGGAVLSQVVPGSQDAGEATAGAALRESPGKQAAAPDTALRATASGTDYTADRLAAQVDQVLAARTASAAAPTGPLATPAGVAACLSAIGAPRATPLLVDVARYQGAPAAVVVLPASGGGHEIWVVSTTCSPGKDGTRYFTRSR
ncbi:MAG: hypothetical protein ACTHN8_08280 [Angustibacter sp.]